MPCADCGASKPYKLPCQVCGGERNRANGGNRVEAVVEQHIKTLLALGRSVRSIADDLEISKVTVSRHRKLFLAERGTFSDIMCPCGRQAFHRGWCNERLKHSPARQAFLSRWVDGRSQQPKIIRLPPRIVTAYPFIQPGAAANGSGHDILLLVNGLVPRGLPEQLRGDVCQEIIAAVLAGEFTEAEVPENVSAIIRRVRREQEGHFMAVSLDAPRRDGRSWHDVLGSAEPECTT